MTLGGGREAKFDLDFFDSLDRLKEFAALRRSNNRRHSSGTRNTVGPGPTVPAAPAAFFCF